MLVIPALERLRQEDHQCKVILGYIVSLYLKTKQMNNHKNHRDNSPVEIVYFSHLQSFLHYTKEMQCVEN
jgi:hypothetical protein